MLYCYFVQYNTYTKSTFILTHNYYAFIYHRYVKGIVVLWIDID